MLCSILGEASDVVMRRQCREIGLVHIVPLAHSDPVSVSWPAEGQASLNTLLIRFW